MRELLIALVAAAIAVMFQAPTSAAPVVLQSGSPGAGQSESCANPFNSATTCQVITPHPQWQPPNPVFAPGLGFEELAPSAARWVSFAATGYRPDTFRVPQNIVAPSLTYTFAFFATGGQAFRGWVWADDTASIVLDGASLHVADTDPANNTICQNGTPGCQRGRFFSIDTYLGPGTEHSLGISAFQIGTGRNNTSNPFGVMMVGATEAVSQPAAVTLLAAGLLMVGGGRRFRMKALTCPR